MTTESVRPVCAPPASYTMPDMVLEDLRRQLSAVRAIPLPPQPGMTATEIIMRQQQWCQSVGRVFAALSAAAKR